jgi:4-hydroxy-4-methyl-2-oxoglutarate aldolase
VTVGGARIRQGDLLVLDVDGVAVVELERVDEVLAASRERAQQEEVKRAMLQAGELSFELDGLAANLEAARS